MAITTSNPDYEEWLPYERWLGRGPTTECFYCGKPAPPPAVMWTGKGGPGSYFDLILHPPCLMELFLRLGRDVWQLECQHHAETVADLPKPFEPDIYTVNELMA